MKNTRMCVGIVGAGVISDIYLKNMTTRFHNLYVKSICARHLDHARAKAQEYGICAVTYEEMLNDNDIDIIVNLTPVSVHYDVIKAALDHGKHVYTEKTLTDDIKRSRELVSLAEKKELYLASAPDTFFSGALQRARTAIDEGLIGEVNSFAISGNRNNDILLSALAYLREPGSGITYDYAVYYVTALVSLFGPAVRVGSIVRTPYPTHINCLPQSPEFGQVMDTPNESQINAVIQMKNGITGTLHIDADNIFSDQAWFMIYGTKGILMLTNPDHFGGQVKYIRESPDPDSNEEPVVLWNYTPYTDNSRGVGISDMADALAGQRACRAGSQMAFHVQEVLSAILKGENEGHFTDIVSSCTKPEPLVQSKVPVSRLAHVAYNVKDMDSMLKFYKEVLGMKELFALTLGDLYDTITDRWNKQGQDEVTDAGEQAFVKSLENLRDKKWLVYLKLADRQYLELFYDIKGFGLDKIEGQDRSSSYGYQKMNFEVKDISEVREKLVKSGVDIREDIHPTVNGSMEIMVYDPDGNEVQFTEYSHREMEWLGMDDRKNPGSCSLVNCTTQVAYQVKDAANMLDFYTKGLNLKHAGRLTYADLASAMEKCGVNDEIVESVRAKDSAPWIDYIELAPHQYIELFYGPKEREAEDVSRYYGYQHISIEVSDIQETWDTVVANGLKPDSDITLGCDNAYQFWLTDPDGNRMEMHCYTNKSKQLL